MRNVHTDATSESIRVSIDFFRFIADSMLFTCNESEVVSLKSKRSNFKLIEWMKSSYSQHVNDEKKNVKFDDDKSHTVGRRLPTLLSFELMPPNVERWKTSAPSVACACEITPSICNT